MKTNSILNEVGKRMDTQGPLRLVLAGLMAFFLGRAGAQAQPCLTWVHRTDVGSPGQRAHHAMAYDTDRHVTVFFGGEIGTGGNETYFNDTWEYNGTNWTRITVNGGNPPARSLHSMAYDPVHHQIVMHGGRDANGERQDTWTYQGNGTTGAWAFKNDGLDRTAEGAMVWDSVNAQVLLVQGGLGHRFLWNGSSYAESGGNIAGAHLYYAEAMVFDPVLGMAIAAGGYTRVDGGEPAFTADDALTFTANGPVSDLADLPSPREYSAMAYDSRRNKTVIVGGDNGQANVGESVLEYDSALPNLGWQTGIALPLGVGRAGAAMDYDEARGVMVLMGGAGEGAPNGNDGGRYSDTWELTPAGLDLGLESPGGIICKGEPLTIRIKSVSRPVTYQWHTGVPPLPIAGATNAELFIPQNDAEDTVRYTVIVRDDCGNPFSRFVSISTQNKPVVSGHTIFGATNQCPGGAIHFYVSCNIDAPATLQWYRNGALLPGQTNDNLNLPNLTKGDSGNYHLVLSSACGVVDTLSLFNLPLQVGPSITSQPVSLSANPCDAADFTVAATGVGTLRYEWRMDGVPLTNDFLNGGYFSGTSSAHLHIEPLVYALERSFDVVVTDDCGSANAVVSDPASLQLPTPPWVEVAMNPQPPKQENRRGNWVSAYDENRGVLVMYGGVDDHRFRENSLWEYDGITWTAIQDGFHGPVTTNGQNLFLNDTVAPTSYAAVYNPDDHLVYIIGDVSASQPMTIWSWDGKTWRRPYSGPTPGGEMVYHAVYDRVNRKILIIRSHNESSFLTELLAYDSASNLLSAAMPMQPPVDYGESQTFWVYDEYRNLAYWYQSNFLPPSMWALDPSMNWLKLSGVPTPPQFAFYDVTYDPIRRHVVAFGSASVYPFDTSTRIFPGSSSSGLPAATDWMEALPDGPPRNQAGLDLSPTNTFFPETIAFDRRRRALVAPGYVGPVSVGNTPPFPTWTTYESRYKDAVAFDRPPVFTKPVIGGTLSLKAYAAGFGPLTYRWRHNGAEITNGVAGASGDGGLVSGATNSTMEITGLTQSDLGAYDVIVSNLCGLVASAPVTVRINGPISLSAPAIANGMLTIHVTADPGTTLTIESALSLLGAWSKVTNAVASAAGLAQFIQPLPEEKAHFYRALSPAY